MPVHEPIERRRGGEVGEQLLLAGDRVEECPAGRSSGRYSSACACEAGGVDPIADARGPRGRRRAGRRPGGPRRPWRPRRSGSARRRRCPRAGRSPRCSPCRAWRTAGAAGAGGTWTFPGGARTPSSRPPSAANRSAMTIVSAGRAQDNPTTRWRSRLVSDSDGGATRRHPPAVTSGRAAGRRCGGRRELRLVRLEPRHEILERGGADDLVELGPVVRQQADAIDAEVVHLPLAGRAVHPVVEGHAAPVAQRDPRLHDGVILLDRLAQEGHARGGSVLIHLGDVRALDQLGEEAPELRALGRRALGPVLPQRPLRHLAEVEDLGGDPADGRATLVATMFTGQRRVVEDLDHPADPIPQLIGGSAGPGAEHHR